MANVELLDKVMRHIEHNEHMWNQTSWSNIVVNGWSGEELRKMLLDDPKNPVCGTQRCFAGHAVAFEGWTPIFEIGDYVHPSSLDDGFTANYCVNKEGDRAFISSKAIELLQIDGETADILFAPTNDLDDLRRMVAHVKKHGDLLGVCSDCSGTGEVEDSCFECGNITTNDCSGCEGSGQVRW